MPLDPSQLAAWVDLVQGILTSAAVIGAGWWFLRTTRAKPRIQFDLECRVFPLDPETDTHLVEIAFVFSNTGFVEHRLYDLSVSVHGLPTGGQDKGTRTFSRRLLPRTGIVPPQYQWYFVRPGVRQVITHTVVLHRPGPLIQVTAGFSYRKREDWPHTARRVFEVGSRSDSNSRGAAP